MSSFYAKNLCYLTPKAQEALNALLSIPELTDPDLALSVLERLWPEAEIYDLGGSDE